MELKLARDLIEEIPHLMAKVKEEKPLIHHITNFVVMNDTANLTLVYGALPVMAHAIEEVEEMVGIAQALILNPGTLTPSWVESMIKAGKRANELGIPIILDPVGAGATRLRTESNLRLLKELKVTVLRGNPGEIAALMGNSGLVKGVESVGKISNLEDIIYKFATSSGLIVAATGERDIISDGERIVAIDNGHSWLRTITGTGCMSTTAVAVFCAVTDDSLLGTMAGLTTFEIAAEMAAPKAIGPQSFKVALLDVLYNLTPEDVINRSKIYYLR